MAATSLLGRGTFDAEEAVKCAVSIVLPATASASAPASAGSVQPPTRAAVRYLVLSVSESNELRAWGGEVTHGPSEEAEQSSAKEQDDAGSGDGDGESWHWRRCVHVVDDGDASQQQGAGSRATS